MYIIYTYIIYIILYIYIFASISLNLGHISKTPHFLSETIGTTARSTRMIWRRRFCTVAWRTGSRDRRFPWWIYQHCPPNMVTVTITTGWWFGTFFIFPYIGNNHPNFLIFLRGVETTNQINVINGWVAAPSQETSICSWNFMKFIVCDMGNMADRLGWKWSWVPLKKVVPRIAAGECEDD